MCISLVSFPVGWESMFISCTLNGEKNKTNGMLVLRKLLPTACYYLV